MSFSLYVFSPPDLSDGDLVPSSSPSPVSSSSSSGHQGWLASLVCKCNSECDHCPMFVKIFNKSLLRKGPRVLHGCVDLKDESRTECSIQSWSQCRQCH